MPGSGQIVVITDRKDAHVPYVQKHLDKPFIVLDPHSLLEGKELSFALHKNRMIVTYGDVCLDNVQGVWHRKPRDILPQHVPVAEEFKTYSSSALLRQTLQVLTSFPDAVWVSKIAALRNANNKAWQLEEAAKLGFRVPHTIMTTNADRARAFIETEGTCIVKPHGSYVLAGEKANKAFYATKIDKASMPNLSNLQLAPAIFQQWIDADFDVRVTVVGDEVFPAIIRTRNLSPSAIRDWRIGHYDGEMTIEAYEHFPSDIARLCSDHVKRMGLRFGAIDLVMDKRGKLWFLENNPNGQWGFVERATGQPIGKSLAALLSSRSKTASS